MKKALTQEQFDALHSVDMDFSDYDLRICNLSGKTFVGASFTGAALTGVDMSTAQFEKCDFTNCDMVGVNMTGSVFSMCKFNGSRMYEITTTDADFWKCNFTGVGFEYSTMNNTILCACDFYEANLFQVTLTGSNLSGSNFTDACLEEAILDQMEDIGCIGDGEYIKIIRVGEWDVSYTHDTLQIGNEQRSITDWKANPKSIELVTAWGPDESFIQKVLTVVTMFPAKDGTPE